MESVSVLGLGAMGSRIALRLLDAGHDVVVWNRSPDRLEPLLARGARPASSPRDAVRRSHTLITMLADPDALRAVSEGPEGIAAGIHPDLVTGAWQHRGGRDRDPDDLRWRLRRRRRPDPAIARGARDGRARRTERGGRRGATAAGDLTHAHMQPDIVLPTLAALTTPPSAQA